MKIITMCVLFFIACGPAMGNPDADTTQSIFPQQLTARELLTYCASSSMTDLGRKRQRYCWGFVSGVEETIRLPLHATKQPKAQNICVPKDVSSRSLAKAYSQYARRRNTNLARPAVQIVVEALSSAYPCQN